MWWILFLCLHSIHVCDSRRVTYTRIPFNVVGIFEKDAIVQSRAFNESLSSVTKNNYYLTATTITPSRTDSYSAWRELCKDTEVRPIAIFGPQSTSDIMVREQCSYLQIPHLQASWQPFDPDTKILADIEPEAPADEQEEGDEEEEESPVFKNVTINFYPDSEDIANAFSTLLKHYHWRNFAAFYEDDYGLQRIQTIIAKHSSIYPIFVRRLNPNGENNQILKIIKTFKIDRILLDCHAERIKKYMDIAFNLGVVDEYYHFIFVSLDASIHAKILEQYKFNTTWLSLTSFDVLNNVQHFLSSRVPMWVPNTTERPNVIDFQLDSLLMADVAKHLINALGEMKSIESPSFPVCPEEDSIEPWEYGAILQDKILKMNTTGVTGKISFNETTGKRINYVLYVNEIHLLTRKTIAEWHSETPEELEINSNAKDNSTESTTKVFKIISKKAKPYFFDKEPCEGDNCTADKYEGFAYDLATEIFNTMHRDFKLNYTFEFVWEKDEPYGKYDPDKKKWNGLIGKILDKEADLAICDLTITEERKTVVDFSVPFMSMGISILYTKEHKVVPGMFSFLAPYTFDVWLYTATAYCIVSLVLFICARLSPADWENPQPCDKDPEELENIWNFKNSTWLTMGSIMTQGCDILPKAFGSRWVCAMWWFFTVIVSQTYIAQLSASMTSSLENEPINSVEDLAKQTKILYGAVDGGSTLSFFKNANDKIYQTMYKNMMDNPAVLVRSNEEGERRVSRGNKYAFFMESSTIEYKLKRNCELKKVGPQLDSKDYGIAMPVNSPFRTHINQAILKLKEVGTIDKIKKIWWNERYGAKNCTTEADESDVEGDLEISNLIGAFVVLVFGLFLCLFITAAEFMDEVRNIVVREQVTHKEAFIKELKASLNFFQLQKPIQRNPSRAPSVISDESQLETKRANRALALENFMDSEKMVQ